MNLFYDVGFIVGFLSVASNPSPYFAALGLVVSAGFGCLMMMEDGGTFLCLALFMVYLGGMMVVFAYSVALVAEPYPVDWGEEDVLVYFVAYLLLVSVWWCAAFIAGGVMNWEGSNVYIGDWMGGSMLFSWGGGLLLFAVWGLLLTLFAVLEVVRGHYSGALRAV